MTGNAELGRSCTPGERRTRLGWLAVVGAGALLALVATYAFFVRTTLGQELDEAALVGSEHEAQGVISEAWELLDVISVGSLAVATAAIAAVALLRRRVALAVAALATIGGANVATQLLKKVILERPDLIGAGDSNSLPSGHATVAATVAFGVVMVTAPRWRSPVALVAMLFPVAVGVAVVTAAWHRPSDSVAAIAVVLAAAATCLGIAVALFGFEVGRRPPRWFRASVMAVVGAVIVLLAGAGALGLALVRRQIDDGVVTVRWETVAYASSTAAIAAATLAAMLILAVALRGMRIGQGGWD
ncbi:MAG: phosphatase PAP2 family protein [Acidimicrobiia bacterium]|nr:phosphatase PAP2 family protein [Acidimicrobiia bacterium]